VQAIGRRIDVALRGRPGAAYLASGLLLALITWVDYATGYDLGLFVLYFVPVGIAAWWGTRRAGLLVALAAAACWYGSDFLSGHEYPHAYLGWWETFMRFVSYVTTALTLSRIREGIRRQEMLLAVVSHDLKAPLTALTGQARILRRQEAASPFAVARAEAILRAAGRMASLIDDLVDGARYASGRLALRLERVPLRSHLLQIVAGMEGAQDVGRVRLEVPEDPALAVRADPARLERIFGNLLSNALKYSPEEASVTVTGERRDGRVVVAVQDQGPGVAAEDLPHLFQPYFRGASARRTEGIGLGLHGTRLLVEAHGGAIDVANAPGGGAVFRVDLPAWTDGSPTWDDSSR
jgi:signal transduction histidine kinase